MSGSIPIPESILLRIWSQKSDSTLAILWHPFSVQIAFPTSGQTEVEDIGLGGTMGSEDNGLSLSYCNISPANATADSNWSIKNSTANYQICVTIPPAIIPSKNSAILAATF